MKQLINSVKESLRSIAPFEWLAEVHALLEPPQGYITDNADFNEELNKYEPDETQACLMMILEGLNCDPEDPHHDELKALFLDCCERLWDDNSGEC